MAEIRAKLTPRDEAFLHRSLNGTMWKVILTIGTPLAFYQGMNQLFSMLDTMMASYISKESVSAVAYLTQLSSILSALGGGLAVGAGIQISRAYGEGNFRLVRKRVSSLYFLCFLSGILIMAAILPFVNAFLHLAGTPEELIAVGALYFRVELCGMVVKFLNNVYIAVERARGNSRRIMRLNFLVIGVKLFLTALFVYILHGDLVMIAIASLISQCTLLVFALRYSFGGGDGAFSFSPGAIALNRQVTAPMITQSIPVIAEKALFAFGKTVVNSMCTLYGAVMVGAMGVSNNLGGVTTMPQNGFQEGAAAIISQNVGAKKYRRVYSAFFSTIVINIILGAVISGFELWQIDFFAGLFDSGSADFHRMIALVYRYEALGAVPLGVNAAVLALLYGLGETKLTLALNFARVFIFRIPVFWFLQNYTNFGEASVGIVMMVSNISVAVSAVIVAIIVLVRFRKQTLSPAPTASPDPIEESEASSPSTGQAP
ncbi:MAG: MATE family efflux transporter [Lachnospiraceae bacterium]|nr:MATE family efflux transporter [Lachnospiraceae bacterium]